MFTHEMSSWDETRPGTKSSLSMVKYLLLFRRFCRDEILSWDELIPVKKTGMKFHPRMKKRNKRCVNISFQDEILKWAFLKNFWRMCSNILFKVNMFEPNESMNILKYEKRKKDEGNKWNIKNLKIFLLFPLFSLWSLEKIEISFSI